MRAGRIAHDELRRIEDREVARAVRMQELRLVVEAAREVWG